MSEDLNTEEVQELDEPSFKERFLALENQSYVMYLQLNALTAKLVEQGTIDKDKLVEAMSEFDKEIQKIAKEIQEGEV